VYEVLPPSPYPLSSDRLKDIMGLTKYHDVLDGFIRYDVKDAKLIDVLSVKIHEIRVNRKTNRKFTRYRLKCRRNNNNIGVCPRRWCNTSRAHRRRRRECFEVFIARPRP